MHEFQRSRLMSSYVERLRINLEDVDRIAFKVVLWFIYTDKIYPYIKGELLTCSLLSRTFKEVFYEDVTLRCQNW